MLPHPWPRYFPVSAVAHCTKHKAWQRIRKREKRSKWCSLKVVTRYPSHTIASWGTWCSGIASASHAEGPGFKSQCVHLSRMACVNCTCVPSATAHLKAFLHVVSELPHPWPRYFPVLAEAHCIKHQISQRIRKREKRSKSCSLEVVLGYS